MPERSISTEKGKIQLLNRHTEERATKLRVGKKRERRRVTMINIGQTKIKPASVNGKAAAPKSDSVEIWVTIPKKYAHTTVWERATTGGRRLLGAVVEQFMQNKPVHSMLEDDSIEWPLREVYGTSKTSAMV